MEGIGWFSGGVTSSVAIKKCLDFNLKLDIFFFETGQHHPDTLRFLKDCENWYNQKIVIIKNKKFNSVMDVFNKGYINSPSGAFCTKLMKKDMRIAIEKIKPFDFQVFGFEYEDKQVNRAIRFNQQYPESKAIYPLIDLRMNKTDCFIELNKAGIEIPEMYRLGFSNNNCIGCVKGGKGYWNKTREVFPDHFKAMAELERKVKATCLKENGKKLYLDQLDPSSGRHEDISLPECGVVCPPELDGLKPLTCKEAYKVESYFFDGNIL